jgi:hypothetical protein
MNRNLNIFLIITNFYILLKKDSGGLQHKMIMIIQIY